MKEDPRFSDSEIAAQQARIDAGAQVKPFNMLCTAFPTREQRAAENFRVSMITDAISEAKRVS